MSVTIRPVRAEDAGAIAAIYAPYVTASAISFETEPPDAAAMAARIERTTQRHPWLVLEAAGAVAGYAYGYEYRTRAAYAWVCETGIYLARDRQGKGLGGRLYEALLDALTDWGYVSVIASIALPNRASVTLHERLGFEAAGVQRGIGFKGGAWHDVGFWQLDLAPRPAAPKRPGPAG